MQSLRSDPRCTARLQKYLNTGTTKFFFYMYNALLLYSKPRGIFCVVQKTRENDFLDFKNFNFKFFAHRLSPRNYVPVSLVLQQA